MVVQPLALTALDLTAPDLTVLDRMAYVPPHQRGPAQPKPSNPSDWLKAQQSRYVSTPQTKAEPLTFELQRKNAGPPPNVTASDFWSEGDINTDMAIFDMGFSAFKRGLGPPPTPLRDDNGMACSPLVNAYYNWYDKWGFSLNNLWNAEHPQKHTKINTNKLKDTYIEEESAPRRPGVAEVCANSGW